ncbi:YwiC-like family protein [Pleurocapsa sp. PCC 7319]|uniref:YwiC-like family protein n=1 Tax=Pleurocapsa sp. PCC 7319 TaxID=118161 RepID=UPI000348F82E|nr:YwiC-like family protein [Pleurocapsa sp. PCC 7319]
MSDSRTLVSTNTQIKNKKTPIWSRPTFSPEHGVILVLFGSFLTGAALAQRWTSSTTLALICAFFTLQVEHPYVVQIKLRKNWKLRYLVWGGVYSSIALSLAIFLWLQSSVLLWLYILVIIGFIVDAIAVIKGKHKSRVNEIIGFATICLSAPLAYGATTGSLSMAAMAIWILNTLFFSSAVYTIKLRRKKTAAFKPGVIYHCTATLIVISLYSLDYLSLVTALSFTLALIKLVVVFGCKEWYRQAKFHSIAIFETRFALLYIAIASISLLPAHLPPN